MIDIKIIFLLTIAILGSFSKSHYEAKLYFTDYCTNFGYPSEKFYFISKLIYILIDMTSLLRMVIY